MTAVALAVPGEGTVRAPRQILATGGEVDVHAQVAAAGLRLPLLAKSLQADGSSDSHKVAIIHDRDGLSCVSRGDVPGLKPPCIVQEYVNHGGCLFKVYVVGDTVTMTRRKSLPDLRGVRRRARRSRRRSSKGVEAGAAGSDGSISQLGGGGGRTEGRGVHCPGSAAVDSDDDKASASEVG